MLVGAAISVGALLFWIYVNELAFGWSTSNNASRSYNWLTLEALIYFWVPFATGAVIALLGWKSR